MPTKTHEKTHRRTVGLGLWIALVVTGCTLDPAKISASIEGGLEERGVKVKSVTCPDGKKDKSGDTFECEGRTEDDTVFKVAITAKGGGNIEWNLVGKIVDPDELKTNLKQKSGREFDCGKEKRIAVKGVEVDCKEGNTVVAIKFKDNEGDAEIVAKN